MPIVVRLLQRAVHLYQRHNRIESRMQQLRGERLQQLRVYHCQRILLHRLVRLRSRSKDRCQRHCNHGPYLRNMLHRAIFCCNESKRLHKLDHLQRFQRSRKQRRFYDSR